MVCREICTRFGEYKCVALLILKVNADFLVPCFDIAYK